MAIFSIDDCKGVPQMMTLDWEIAKRLWWEASIGYGARGWEEIDSEETEDTLSATFRLGKEMTIVKWVSLDNE